ncbi:hypothetical protein [Lelliottia nimipressuralis]|jgi:type 1 fimbria pilin|uniref:hypothetical protein n=1 Tax=Lelliottia nimipressuralis TaxID=69220 RepID=UPI003D24D50A
MSLEFGRKRNTISSALTLLVISLSIFHSAVASAENYAVMHGTLVVVSCTVNDNKDQTVSFGENLGIHKIDGVNYKMPVPLEITCGEFNGSPVTGIQLSFKRNESSFDNAGVQSSVDGLAIKIALNDQPVVFDNNYDIDYQNLPKITAVPILDPDIEVQPQSFNAVMNIELYMQ